MNKRKHSVKVQQENKEKIKDIRNLFFEINQKITIIQQFEKDYLADLTPKFILPKTQIRPMVANR